MQNTTVILIDFDNVFKKQINDYSKEALELLIKDIIRDVLAINLATQEIKIRLYGGWYKDNLLSSKASIIQQYISIMELFPIIRDGKIVRGSIELATSLYSLPSHIWTNTYKEKNGIPKLRINYNTLPEYCENNKGSCPVHNLSEFTRNKEKTCHHQTCSVKNADVFIGLEQKMVDTLISCDLICCAEDLNIISVCLFSDDIDLLPPLGLSSILKEKRNTSFDVQLFYKNPRNFELVNQIMEPFGIKILQYEQV